jgi:hypothetical protein
MAVLPYSDGTDWEPVASALQGPTGPSITGATGPTGTTGATGAGCRCYFQEYKMFLCLVECNK